MGVISAARIGALPLTDTTCSLKFGLTILSGLRLMVGKRPLAYRVVVTATLD